MRIEFKDKHGEAHCFEDVSALTMVETAKRETGNGKPETRALRPVPLVGLCGRAGAGKDTLFKAMQANLVFDRSYRTMNRRGRRFVRLAFADALKRAAAAIVGFDLPEDLAELDKRAPAGIRWGELKHGLWNFKHDPDAEMTVRDVLQVLGTEVLREGFCSDVWLRRVKVEIERRPDTAFVVTDCRFPNELQMIRDLGGVVWRIDRPGLGEDADGHASEHAWRDFEPDAVIENQYENVTPHELDAYLGAQAEERLAKAWPHLFK